MKTATCILIIYFCRTTDYASCTALSTFEQDIASVGEDGKLNLLTAAEKKPVRIIGKHINKYRNAYANGYLLCLAITSRKIFYHYNFNFQKMLIVVPYIVLIS